MGDEEERVPPGKYTFTKDDAPAKSVGFTGTAKAEYANGDIYEGNFVEGQRQGKGKYTYFKELDVFEGTFENNEKQGLGRVTYKKGGYFHGHFEKGKREGEGTFKYATGDIYSGMWKDHKKHGPGTYVFFKTKYEYKGEWKDGQIVQGTWSLQDKAKYVGGFQSQKPCGDGIWQFAEGTIVEGAYVQQVVPLDDKPAVGLGPGKTPAMATKTFWKTATMVAMEEEFGATVVEVVLGCTFVSGQRWADACSAAFNDVSADEGRQLLQLFFGRLQRLARTPGR